MNYLTQNILWYEDLENIVNSWLNEDDEESKEETTRGGFSSNKSQDDSPDAISGKYKSLDDAFADLDSL